MGVFLVVLVVVGIYLVSLCVHPWWSCSSCGESKRSAGRRGAHGRCLRCRGEGRYPRLGVKILMPGTARRMREGEKGRFF